MQALPSISDNSVYDWVVVITSGRTPECASSWSHSARIIVPPLDLANSPYSAPIWAQDEPNHAFLRSEIQIPPSPPIPSSLAVAVVFATASRGDLSGSSGGDTEAFRLVGAYKLYLDGQLVSVGPGRDEPKVTSDVTKAPYDTLDVTEMVRGVAAMQTQQKAAPSPMVVAIQPYHGNGSASFMVQAGLHL
jgi:hypothetical protein